MKLNNHGNSHNWLFWAHDKNWYLNFYQNEDALLVKPLTHSIWAWGIFGITFYRAHPKMSGVYKDFPMQTNLSIAQLL